MNPAYLPIFSFWLIMFVMMNTRKRNQKTIIANRIINNGLENKEMFELAKKFIEKECMVCLFDGNYVNGVIKEVTEGGLLVEKKGKTEVVNLNFVVKIKEIVRK